MHFIGEVVTEIVVDTQQALLSKSKPTCNRKGSAPVVWKHEGASSSSVLCYKIDCSNKTQRKAKRCEENMTDVFDGASGGAGGVVTSGTK